MESKVRYIKTDPIKPSKLPLVIGYFGCIHVMHQQLLTAYDQFNVLTFTNIPSKQENQIYGFGDRLRNIKFFKPENIYVYDILSQNMLAEEFIIRVLMKIQPTKILVGNDFVFGSDHKSWRLLQKYFKVEVINYNKNVSTTKIAGLLKEGKIEEANDLLHCPYHYISRWIGGQKKGRLLGARTINLLLERKAMIPFGSYVSRITIGHKTFNSISFYGQSETTQSTKATLETHVINKVIVPRFLVPWFIKDKVKVEFLKFIRPYKPFKTQQELSDQIRKDIDAAKDYFEHNI